jgi:hypothetical protein
MSNKQAVLMFLQRQKSIKFSLADSRVKRFIKMQRFRDQLHPHHQGDEAVCPRKLYCIKNVCILPPQTHLPCIDP